MPERAALRRDLDEDAEWAAIVSAFEAEHGRAVVAEEPAHGAPARAARAGGARPPDEHYEPPPPPPLPVPAPASLYAVLLVVGRVLLVFAPGLLRLSADVGLVLGVAGIAAGFVTLLVARMRDRDRGRRADDGAVV